MESDELSPEIRAYFAKLGAKSKGVKKTISEAERERRREWARGIQSRKRLARSMDSEAGRSCGPVSRSITVGEKRIQTKIPLRAVRNDPAIPEGGGLEVCDPQQTESNPELERGSGDSQVRVETETSGPRALLPEVDERP